MSAAHRALSICAALAFGGALLWGGATQAPALRALMLASSLVLALAWVARGRLGQARASASASFLALLLLASLLALLPLPEAIYRAAHPAAAALRAQTLGSSPAWRPITDDVGGTLLCAGRLAALLAFALAFGSLARSPRRVLPGLLLALLALCVLVAGLSVVGVELPAPLHAPRVTRAWVRSPLQNPNHLGAIVSMLLPIAWAMLTRTSGAGRLGLVFLIVAANALAWATRSRGALFGAALGQLAAILWLLGRLGTSAAYRRPRRALAGLLACLGAASLVVEVLQRGPMVDASDAGRLGAWRDALLLLREHAVFGVGPGAFSLVFARYGTVAGRLRHAFIENQYLQLALDHGLALGLGLLGAGVYLATRALRSGEAHGQLARGATIGLVVLALHELADFSTWGGAVALAAVALAALAEEGRGRLLGGGVVALVVVLPLALALASQARPTASEEEAGLARALEAAEPASIEGLGRRALEAHPADVEIPLLVAARLVSLDAASAPMWIEAALRLGPRDARAHAYAAITLARAGLSSQAAGELQAALAGASQLDARTLGDVAVALFADRPELLARALRAAPADFTAEVLGLALAKGKQATVRAALDELLTWRADADRLGAAELVLLRQRLAVGLALDERETLAPWVEQVEAQPRTAADRLLAARAWERVGKPARAEAERRAVLRDGGERERGDAAMDLSRVLAAAGKLDEARGLLEAERARAIESAEKARLLDRLADLDEQAGRLSRAAVERAEAARLAR